MKNGVIVFFFIYASSITGCSHTEPSRYYILSPIKDTTSLTSSDFETKHIIGVGPIKFPDYLARSQIIRFSGKNEILVDEYNRWAEPIEQSFTRVLRTNLTRLLPSSYAIGYPWERALKVRFQVMLDIHQFEIESDGTVSLNAHWTIFNVSKKKNIEMVKKFNYSNKLNETHYSNIVAEQSKAIEKLSRDIAEEIQKLLAQ